MSETPSEDRLVYEYKSVIDNMRAKNERLRAVLKRVLSDIEEYERVNNLAPNPNRKHCWDSVADAHAVLSTSEREPT